VAAGIGDYDTYSPGDNFKLPMVNDETRTWLQLTMKQYLKRLKFEHRYRAEQRFTSYGYRNRFRYRVSLHYPLKGRSITRGSYYLNASNEIFFTNRAPYFERNRLFLGAGKEFTELFTLQAGYMQQFDYNLRDETGRGFFQISFLFDINWKKQPGEKVPKGMD